jgi:hypothetical protein
MTGSVRGQSGVSVRVLFRLQAQSHGARNAPPPGLLPERQGTNQGGPGTAGGGRG